MYYQMNSVSETQDKLEILSEIYPNIPAVYKEIINLNAILCLPKGTEHFISDIHGEYDKFNHILNNCSGVIKKKCHEVFGSTLSEQEIDDLCTLVYYPQEKIKLLSDEGRMNKEHYIVLLKQLTALARYCSAKHTRAKVRRSLPPDYSYIIDEMMHAQTAEGEYQKNYYERIYQSIYETGAADEIICAMCSLIKVFAVDHLHIVGDIFDRGLRADKIIETLRSYHSLDIQWGNHDILWMGAAAGNQVMVATVVFLSMKYNTYQIIENGYGISLRRLVTFAEKMYPQDDLKQSVKYAIAAIMFKLEGQQIKQHPEYGLEDRLLLEKVNLDDGTVTIGEKVYPIDARLFITVDRNDPYRLTREEEKIIEELTENFTDSVTLRKHIQFLYAKGSAYKIYNGNLLIHGCVPLDEEGNLQSITIDGKTYKGKSLADYCDFHVRSAYFNRDKQSVEFMLYLWNGFNSPFTGRIMHTFERTYLDDKDTWKEPSNYYYKYIDDEKMAIMILREFNLYSPYSHIICGHTPVHASEGESPVKANKKLLIIDGGFCHAYYKTTGIAGYTLIFNSQGLKIKAHRPFTDITHAISDNADIVSDADIVEEFPTRLYVKDTDEGEELTTRIKDLEELLESYKNGTIRQKSGKAGGDF